MFIYNLYKQRLYVYIIMKSSRKERIAEKQYVGWEIGNDKISRSEDQNLSIYQWLRNKYATSIVYVEH